MGDFNVRAIKSNEERAKFYSAVLRDLEAFDLMLKENGKYRKLWNLQSDFLIF